MESDHEPAGKAPPQAPPQRPLEQSLQEPLQGPKEPPVLQAPLPETLSTDADTTTEPAPPSPNPTIIPSTATPTAATATTTSTHSHIQEESPAQSQSPPQPQPQPQLQHEQQQEQQEEQQQQQQQKSHDNGPCVLGKIDLDRQKGPGGAINSSSSSNVDPSDRVFPIRSVISVDHSQPTPWIHSRDLTEPDYFPRQDSTWDGRRRASTSTPRLVTNVSTTNVSGELSQPPSVLSPTSPRGMVPTPATRPHRGNTITSQPDHLGGQPPKNERPSVSAAPSALNFHDGTPDDKSTRMSIGEAGSVQNEGDNNQPGGLPGSPAGESEDVGFVTTRFQHVKTEDGHAVITGRDGTLQRCEDEPIHTPGAVQGFGLLVALREDAEGRLPVRIVSENSKQIIGYTPHELFNLGSFTDVLSEEQAENLLDHIDFVRDEESDPATSGPDVFSISLRPPKSKSIRLWCAMHLNKAHPDLIICEFEPEDDQVYPIRPPDELTPEEPEDTLYQNPTVEQLYESTEIGSKPLRVLRSARKRRGEAGAMQVFDIMSQVQEQFSSAPNLEKFLKTLVGIVKELTGFHRIMIYQFDAAFNGKVVTELVDPAQTRDLYHGLHFPASDIPKQARDLYKLNKVRLLYDRDLQSARLVCRTVEDLEQPLDMSHAYLRAMSPIHVKYLANMAVRSSMSISINTFGELWGLISCHSYGPKGMRVTFPIRKMCRMIGDTASRNIERLSYASRLQARKLINTMPTDKNPSGYIIASSEDLLKLFDADFGMLSIGDETKVLGKIAQSQEALALLEYLRLRNFTAVLTTQDVAQDFPDLRYTPGFSVISGLLYVPLSVGGHDFIVFFRKGQVREVNWAGNPYEKIIRQGTANYLEPRSSFKAWRETVIGKCREWSEEQVETAAVLCLVYGKFIEVWRQKEAALQSSRLTRLLLANSAHEVRTPLNAIINYLEIALEGSIDQETRENLAKSHSASKSLIYVINDLLDLTKTEEGRELIKDEIMDLPACLLEATEPFKVDAKRKGISYEVIQHPGIPQHVHGDYRRIRQAIANITANAVQSTSAGSVKVECFVVEVRESRVRVEIAVHDTGCGMNNTQLDDLFQDLEQVSSADPGEPEAVEVPLNRTDEGRILGLGLAVVARIVRNMDGQLRLKSEEGLGSRFVIQLPFELPSSDTLEKLNENPGAANTAPDATSLASVTKSMPPTQAGEMMLVDRGSGNTTHGSNRSITKTRSFDDTNSVNSLKSNGSGGARSNKSDADRLIDAIQTPFDPTDADKDLTVQRNNSKGRRPVSNTSLSGSASTGTTPPVAGAQSGAQPAVYPVLGTNIPVKPVKMPDGYSDQTATPQNAQSSRVIFELPQDPSQEKDEIKPKAAVNTKPDKLRVLIAEDDPINMKVLTKRLEKTGHEVCPAVNGEDCLTVYKEKSQVFDVVLMDMQMPIVDGLTSTKLIRAFEKSGDCSGLSTLGLRNGHIPIFAVSASLVEKDKPVYTDAGFDGWILKPIDYKRLNLLLDGIADDDVREKCLYQPGEWERGGWFARRATE